VAEHEHPVLDDLFHGCALAAFLERAVAEGGWPCVEATRRLAYDLYENSLAQRILHDRDDRREIRVRGEQSG
jgi:hypothetical protein